MNEDKKELIEEIKLLISVDGTKIDINPNYLEFFELEELIEIKNELLNRKKNSNEFTKTYVDELYDKLSNE